MDSLFGGFVKKPLADRMRPQKLSDFVSQEKAVGAGSPLRRMIERDQLQSVLFYGPPGTGKTTLAQIIAQVTGDFFVAINAVSSGVPELRKLISGAQERQRTGGGRTIVFIDEIHRFNKAQQDVLLPYVENGTIILVGATTENPFFEINAPLLSRMKVFQLKPLEKNNLRAAADAALCDKERGYGAWRVEFEEGALEHLIDTANGDARSLLNALELAVETTPEKWKPNDDPPLPAHGATIFISREAAEESIQKKVVLYDRDGDYHYDIISAFIKSLRGRDPDAAMYWMARMIRAGEDPHFIFRRMLISACEDTGLADPMAITVVESSARAFDRVGLPEGNYFLAHAALYLSTAPKSNSSMAFFDAISSVEKEDADVPSHLKDNSRDAEGFGHGEGYMYPHAYRDHWIAQQYLPQSLQGRVFYTPSDQGYEKTIRSDVLARRELQIAALLEEEENIRDGKKQITGEQLTYTGVNNARDSLLTRGDSEWKKRLDVNRAQTLLTIRDTMTLLAGVLRHHRCFIWGADDGLLVWEVARKCPEGFTAAVCKTKKACDVLGKYGATLETGNDIVRPALALLDLDAAKPGTFSFPEAFGDIPFDRLFFRNILSSAEHIRIFIDCLVQAQGSGHLAQNVKVITAEHIPSTDRRLSDSIQNAVPLFKDAEDAFFSRAKNLNSAWTYNTFTDEFMRALTDAFPQARLTVKNAVHNEKKALAKHEIEHWFSPESAYGAFIVEHAGTDAALQAQRLLTTAAQNGVLLERDVETAFAVIEF